LLEFSGAIIIFGGSSYNRNNHSYSFAMNIKTQLLEAIEQAPDSVIQETFNFLLSAKSDNLHSQSLKLRRLKEFTQGSRRST
jgi:FKBP-type peptidyl-prolyl cis-trans isomerase (trigger factor)